MITISNILFTGLLISSIWLGIIYTYIAVWRIPKEAEQRETLSWYAMISASGAIFCLLLAWRVKEPLAKDFIPVFFILSLIIGYLLRESAISPFQLAGFWSKFGSSSRKNKKEDDTKTVNRQE